MKVTSDACLFGAWVAEKLKVGNVLDIGCGTGLLSLMLAQKCNVEIDAIEIDDEATAQAIENTAACSFKNSIQIFNTDIRDFHSEKKYDVIISNPPFYSTELKSSSAKKNVAHHSDNLSMEELLDAIKKNLSGDGVFFLLLPFKRDEEIRNMLHEKEMTIVQITLVRQSIMHDYFRLMLMGKIDNNIPEEITFDEISIKDEREQYTEEFVRLLENYYLYL